MEPKPGEQLRVTVVTMEDVYDAQAAIMLARHGKVDDKLGTTQRVGIAAGEDQLPITLGNGLSQEVIQGLEKSEKDGLSFHMHEPEHMLDPERALRQLGALGLREVPKPSYTTESMQPPCFDQPVRVRAKRIRATTKV